MDLELRSLATELCHNMWLQGCSGLSHTHTQLHQACTNSLSEKRTIPNQAMLCQTSSLLCRCK